MRFSTQILTTLALLSLVSSKGIYDQVKSYVTVLTARNFDSQVLKNRQKGITVVHFYKETDGVSKGLTGGFEIFTKENKGLFRMGGLDCLEFASICAKENIDKFPTFRVYPAFPAPVQDYEEETIDFEKLKKMASRFVTSRVVEITANNHETFLNDQVDKPKVLLFTDKKGIPVIFKGLSSHFDKTLFFGLIRNSEAALVSKYKIKSYPAIIMLKEGEMRPIRYDGKEFSYQAVFDFINIYSETFVFRGDQEEVKSAATKPWLNDKIPNLTIDSADDICMKKEGSLCVIYIAKNAESKDVKAIDLLYQTGQQFASKISRGITFSFMWLDATTDSEFFSIFGIQAENLPSIVILNPGKRKRYLVHPGDINETNIEKTLDKILGGDAKFTNIKGNTLPSLVSKYPTQ